MVARKLESDSARSWIAGVPPSASAGSGDVRGSTLHTSEPSVARTHATWQSDNVTITTVRPDSSFAGSGSARIVPDMATDHCHSPVAGSMALSRFPEPTNPTNPETPG